ncbi:MAG: hypothetical protein KUG79_04065 [Pseudomonadales bacterium]|nr:hypothetical protein [Pseudomonadales bacterium]
MRMNTNIPARKIYWLIRTSIVSVSAYLYSLYGLKFMDLESLAQLLPDAYLQLDMLSSDQVIFAALDYASNRYSHRPNTSMTPTEAL